MIFIDNQKDFDAAMARVAAQPVIALDTEADSLHSYFDKVCLIQMSFPGEDLIISTDSIPPRLVAADTADDARHAGELQEFATIRYNETIR